ncbi:MAG: hypothetical protein ACOX02_02365 [Acholeplasmatales bacterium]
MKKLFIPLIILLLSGLIVLNYLAYKSPKIKKMISQRTIYQTSDDKLNIALYSNYKGPYQTLEAIESVYLFEEGKRLEVILLEINKSYNYKYLKETFHKYVYTLTLPVLENHYYMNEAYLEINLKNGESETFLLGSFDYYYQENHNLDLVELHATKYDDAYQIKDISIKFNLDREIFIKKIKLSNEIVVNVAETIKDDVLVVSVPKLMKIVDALSLVIFYEVDGNEYMEVLPYYLFFDAIENILEYGYLNYVKAIN